MFRRQIKRAIRKLSENSYHTLNWVEIDAHSVLHNVALLRQQHPGFGVMPVLKGNAYGHGLEEIARILNDTDCALLAIDGYFEAAKIRDITRHHILVMGYILPENEHLLDTKKCSFVVQDVEGLRAFGKLHKPVYVHLELNTGMNRLGLQPSELEEYLRVLGEYPNLHLEGVMSHLADADNEVDNSYTSRQVTLFDQLVARIKDTGFHPKYVHIAQTAGSAKVQSRHANSIRLGIGLYGVNPLAQKDAASTQLQALRPALTLKSTVIKTIDLQKGEKVSYNGIFTAPENMRIAVLPLGYYEGLPRELSNKGKVLFGKHDFPIVGRVCMNHTMVAVDETVHVGDVITVISADSAAPNSVANLVHQHKLFSYGILTGVSETVRRKLV